MPTLRTETKKETVTLLFAATGIGHNNAFALKETLHVMFLKLEDNPGI